MVKNMGYLQCKKCGGYYELQEGESPEDYDVCYCGGELEYYHQSHELKRRSDNAEYFEEKKIIFK